MLKIYDNSILHKPLNRIWIVSATYVYEARRSKYLTYLLGRNGLWGMNKYTDDGLHCHSVNLNIQICLTKQRAVVSKLYVPTHKICVGSYRLALAPSRCDLHPTSR